MKIILELKEVAKLEETLGIMGTDLREVYKNNICKGTLVGNGAVEISIREDYVNDVFALTNKYCALMIPQIKSLIQAWNMLSNESEELDKKYIPSEPKLI